MPRAEQIVSRVRRHMARGGDHLAEGAEELAREYSGKVEEINQRLDRCVSLLRQGLRTESLHEAELSPAVLDEAVALDFPERAVWLEQCEREGLGPLPVINTAAVEEIDEAYPRERQLDRLLRSHRRLALGRAPLRARIGVLRQLAKLDTENPLWNEDLLTFERARGKQIAGEAQAAFEHRDAAALAALHQEVCGATWLEPPAEDVKRYVQKAAAQVAQERRRKRLDEITGRLAAAYDQRDAAATRSALEEWRHTAAKIEGATPTPGVQEASAWLAGLDAADQAEADYQRACRALELALDAHKPAEELERLWTAVVRFEKAVPVVLRNRYQAQHFDRTLQGKRRFRLAMLATVGAIAIVAVLIGFIIQLQSRSSNAARWERQVQALADERKWADAAKMMARVQEEDPETWSRPEMQRLAADVDRGAAQAKAKRERFEQAMTAAETAGAADPDREALRTAEQTADTEEDQLRIDRLKAEIQSMARGAQTDRDKLYGESLEAIRKRFTELRDQSDADGTITTPGFEKLRTDVLRLVAMDGISSPLLTTAQTLLTSINASLASAQERMDRGKQTRDALEGLKATVGKPEELSKALTEFAQQFPDHAMAKDFRTSAQMVDVWNAIALVSPALPAGDQLLVRSQGAAQERKAALEELLKQPTGVYKDALSRYVQYLDRAAATLEPANAPDRVDGPLMKLLTNPLVAGLKVLRGKDGKLLYVLSDAPVGAAAADGRVLLKYVGSAEQAFGRQRLSESWLSGANYPPGLTPTASPQAQFAAAAQRRALDAAGQWETFYVSLCAALAGTEVDPVLKVALLTRLATLSVERDWEAMPGVAEFLTRVEGLDTNVNWMAPEDAEASRVRGLATALLAKQPDWSALAGALTAWHERMRADLSPRKAIGIIVRDGVRVSMTSPKPVEIAGIMEVPVRDEAGNVTMAEIGKVTTTDAVWYESAMLQPAGSLVYLRGQ